MHYSQPLVVVTLLLACNLNQVSLAQNACDDLSRKAKAHGNETISPEKHRRLQMQESFNRIDTDGNGVLTLAEVAAQKTSDQGYRREDADAINAQIIEIDRNMDGFIQASEYEELMAEGTIYGQPPNFSEVARSGRIDYCQLSTSLALHHGRTEFEKRDNNNDSIISFKEYFEYMETTRSIKLDQGGTADGAIKRLQPCHRM